MQFNGILIVAMTAGAVLAAPGYAQQRQGNRSQTDLRQDERYLVYMRGIT